MSIIPRNGHWHYRFQKDGHTWTGNTGLADTKRNRKAAERIELEAHQAVQQGHGHLLKIQAVPFSEAAERFLLWCKSQHAGKPNTWKRISGSLSTLKVHFGKQPVSSISEGGVLDYVAWRRTEHRVKDVTIRHDLHALSKFFRWAIKHNWTRRNPVMAEDIPSDKDAVRINPLTVAQENAYFACCYQYRDLHDLAALMIYQGCRPEELLELRIEDVDLVRGYLTIREGKTEAAKRRLKLAKGSDLILRRRTKTCLHWVFPAIKDRMQHLSLSTVENWHAKVREASGVACVLYDLRHTFATRAAAAGMALPTLAAILGHSGIRSVMKYVHISQADMDAAMSEAEVTRNLPQPTTSVDSKEVSETW